MLKLNREQRREQLLDVAMAIVRERGTDELTLGTLATAAGVSRPIAYDHFSTRVGLLIALFQRLENSYIRTLRNALSAAPSDLNAVADVMSKSYFGCIEGFGPEGLAVSAALRGSEEMARQHRIMTSEYVSIMRLALQPFSAAEVEDLNLLCVGLLGSAEAIAREAQVGRVSDTAAARTMSSLIVGGIGQLDVGDASRVHADSE